MSKRDEKRKELVKRLEALPVPAYDEKKAVEDLKNTVEGILSNRHLENLVEGVKFFRDPDGVEKNPDDLCSTVECGHTREVPMILQQTLRSKSLVQPVGGPETYTWSIT